LGKIGTVRMAYRADIDGLRAVAVLAVMLFHYGVPAVSGGFVGVDVFFVISGFLITGKLVEAWPGARTARGLFAWLGAFYRRRIPPHRARHAGDDRPRPRRRLAHLAPGDYADLGESAAYSALRLGSLFFFWNTGYFDAAADTMPLLHLWSLGVEQFYLAWPIVVAGVLVLAGARRSPCALAAARAGRRRLSRFAVAGRPDDPKAAFFLPFARAWELALGAALVFVPTIASRRLAEAAVVVGLGLIAWATLWLTPGTSFRASTPSRPAWARRWSSGREAAARPLPAPSASCRCSWSGRSPTASTSGTGRCWCSFGTTSMAPGRRRRARRAGSGVARPCFPVVAACREPVRRLRPGRLGSRRVGGAVSALVAVGLALSWSHGVPSRLPPFAGLYSLDVMWDWPCEYPEGDGLPSSYCTFGAPWDSAAHKGDAVG
jgi:hypothetical protein